MVIVLDVVRLIRASDVLLLQGIDAQRTGEIKIELFMGGRITVKFLLDIIKNTVFFSPTMGSGIAYLLLPPVLNQSLIVERH